MYYLCSQLTFLHQKTIQKYDKKETLRETFDEGSVIEAPAAAAGR